MKNRLTSRWVLGLMFCCAGTLMAQETQPRSGLGARIIDPPASLQPGQKVTLHLQYRAPAAETPLHVELQAEKGFTIIASAKRNVSGDGTKDIEITIPQPKVDQRVRWSTWLGTDWRNPSGPIEQTAWLTLPSPETLQLRDQQQKQKQQSIVTFRQSHALTPESRPIGIYLAPMSPWPQAIATNLQQRLETAGFAVCRLSSEELSNPAIVQGDILPTLLIGDIATVPVESRAIIGNYSTSGGKLIALGGPAFSNPQYRVGDAWMNRDELFKKIERDAQLASHTLQLPAQPQGWIRHSARENASAVEILPVSNAPFAGSSAYRFNFQLESWCTFLGQAESIPSNDVLTVFWARGDAKAEQLAVEWVERDGTRWIATIELGTQWKRYVLPESAFDAWPHPRVKGRFGPGDRLHLKNGAKLGFGLAQSHTNELNGNYTIDVGGIGTAALPAADAKNIELALQSPLEAPVIDAVSPSYKLFPVTNMKTLQVNAEQTLAPAANLPTPAETFGLYPRSQAAGIDKNITARYVPLLETHDSSGRPTANAAALLVPSTAAANASTILSVAIPDPNFYAASSTQQWLTSVIQRLDLGLHLAEGGSAHFASFGSEDMPIGAAVRNLGGSTQDIKVTSLVIDGSGKTVFSHVFNGAIDATSLRKLQANWKVPATGNGVYHVVTTLEHKGVVIDRIAHEFRILAPIAHPEFVTAHDGQFWLNGKPWLIHGVNFWPQHSMARENNGLYEHWLSQPSYDQASVARNLEDVKAMGFNLISISYHTIDDPRSLLDILERARELGLKVNLAIADMSGLNASSSAPGKFSPDRVRELIAQARLASNDTVIAYDVAWEPYWGSHGDRKRLDARWRDWIVSQYGSIESAQAAWHFEAPKEENQVSNPLDEQIAAGRKGPAAAMVRDYNRFLNSLLEQTYGPARESIKAMDPNHMVSFRMRAAGDTGAPGCVMYELAGLANVVDIFEPEGYGIMNPSMDVVRRSAFTVQYARALNPALPVVYAEFGKSQWNSIRQAADPAIAQTTAQIYKNLYDTMLRVGGNGTISWWFPGGYRCGERSDYGVINPDRSWRPVSHVIHDYAARMTASRPLPTPDQWLTAPFDDVLGIGGTYQSVEKEFWSIYDQGKLPGLKITQLKK